MTAVAPALEYAWQFCEGLAREGVAHAVMCPGSRSTPLVEALAAFPTIKLYRHVDERSAAFFALGLSRGSGKPAAVVCTSGTAAANLFPAIVEAKYDRVPLLVLTADRPHQLRDTGALQSIDQIKLYGDMVKWFIEMSPPEIAPHGYVQHIARQAVRRACIQPWGPVHCNFPFSEPFLTDMPHWPAASPPSELVAHDTLAPAVPATVARVATLMAGKRRGIIVAGKLDEPGVAEPLARLACLTGYPILADALSGVRSGTHDRSHIVDSYDAFLRDEAIRQRLKPDLVFRIGGWTVSKPLQSLLAEAGTLQLAVDPAGQAPDPFRNLDDVVQAEPTAFVSALGSSTTITQPDDSWINEWTSIDTTAGRAVERAIYEETEVTEPAIAQELGSLIPSGGMLFTGNSMPVRDVDAFFRSRPEPVRVLGNRGVNGIDGLVSTGLGIGEGAGQRIHILMGDVSFIHDVNGLLAAILQQVDATIIVVNNGGGGIFHFLPQAKLSSDFEALYAVPLNVRLKAIVEGYGARHDVATSRESLRNRVEEASRVSGVSVIEVMTNRSENTRAHERAWSAATNAVQSTGVGPDTP